MAAKPYGYWTWNGSRNGLAGVPDDPDNPPVLHEDYIVYALHTSRIARAQFEILFPRLLEAEQARLMDILVRHPTARHLIHDPQALDDLITKQNAQAGVRVDQGPRGGKQEAGTYDAEPLTWRDLT
jgi:hypothetical protein